MQILQVHRSISSIVSGCGQKEKTMSTTMQLSLGTCKPTRPSTSSITTRLPLTKTKCLHTAKPSHVKQYSLELNNEKQTLLTRREAVGLGFSFTFLDLLLQPVSTAAAESIPCDFTATPSGLAYCDKIVGTGSQPEKGQLIKAHYTGKLENGKVFDSSYNRGKPLTFRVGVGEVIKGWDQGILGGDGVPPMLAGGKRTLKIPPELGYGIRGAGCRGGTCIIPPNSVLLFDVEFIGKA